MTPTAPDAFDADIGFGRAVQLLSADVHATTGLRPVITVFVDDEKGMILYNFDGHRFGPLRATSTAEAVTEIAGLVQDDVIESLWTSWPKCPGHGHPAQPDLRSGRPAWVCPHTGTQLSEIGHLTDP